MINLKVTQAQWDCAVKEIQANSEMHIETIDNVNYEFTSSLIDADMKYANGILLVDITHKHGMAKFASENTITTHLADMLGALQCSSTPAPAVN